MIDYLAVFSLRFFSVQNVIPVFFIFQFGKLRACQHDSHFMWQCRPMRGFCSPECRSKQILIDNALERIVKQPRGLGTGSSGWTRWRIIQVFISESCSCTVSDRSSHYSNFDVHSCQFFIISLHFCIEWASFTFTLSNWISIENMPLGCV